MSVKNRLKNILLTIFLRVLPISVICLFVCIPIFWTLITSFKPENTIMQKGGYLPNPFTVDNYFFTWVRANFSQYFKNTVIVSFSAAFFVIILALLTSYALSRFRFAGRKAFIAIFLISQLLPSTVLIIPLFLIFNGIGLIDTLLSLVISYTATLLPFNAVLMKSFVDGVPVALEESAMIDGCSRLQVIFRILLPIVAPGIIAVGAFAFINSWNEFIFPIMFLFSESKFVLSIGLNFMLGRSVTRYGGLAAGSVIALSVPLLVFAFLQKHLVMGLSSGAVKG